MPFLFSMDFSSIKAMQICDMIIMLMSLQKLHSLCDDDKEYVENAATSILYPYKGDSTPKREFFSFTVISTV